MRRIAVLSYLSAVLMAQMLITRFDADGSGELSQGELQNGLAALRQVFMTKPLPAEAGRFA